MLMLSFYEWEWKSWLILNLYANPLRRLELSLVGFLFLTVLALLALKSRVDKRGVMAYTSKPSAQWVQAERSHEESVRARSTQGALLQKQEEWGW